MLRAEPTIRFCIPKRLAIALAAAAILALPLAARADTTDPFQNDSAIWKSFDRYKEEQQQKLFSEMTGDADADAKRLAAERNAAPSDDGTEDKQAEVASPAVPAPQNPAPAKEAASVLAPPERPLDLPALPALSSARFNLPVATTDDLIKPVAHIAHIDSQPDLQVSNQNWLNANEVAQRNAAGLSDGDDTPVNVRYASLPSLKSTAPRKTIVASALKPPPVVQIPQPQQQKMAAADAAACAAIDAYHQQQLEAIRSDRHTLSALQDAIKELGLGKELNFMAGGDAKADAPEASSAPKSAAP